MKRAFSRMNRAFLLLALGGSTLLLGVGYNGCTQPTYGEMADFVAGVGSGVIDKLAGSTFEQFGTDFDVVSGPLTDLAQSRWSHWVETRMPQDGYLH